MKKKKLKELTDNRDNPNQQRNFEIRKSFVYQLMSFKPYEYLDGVVQNQFFTFREKCV